MPTIRTRIRTRILALTGTVIVLMMLFISVVLLLKWREMIITTQSRSAVGITRTFSVTVIDAIIFDEQSPYRKENVLETYVGNFISRLGTVSYVTIVDSSGSSIVQLTEQPELDAGSAIPRHDGRRTRRVRMFEHEPFGWVLEVREPLTFLGRHWGTVTVGFDAEPIREEIRSVFLLLLLSTLGITGVVLLILSVLIRRMTASIEDLVHAIDRIDFRSDAPVDPSRHRDEIGYFFRHFTLLHERLDASRRELAEAQRQVYHAEKLASIGRLASGVAHQVNNPLNGIKSCLYAIRQTPDDTARVQEYLQLINEGIDDIETVVRKLLGFARQQSTSDSHSDLNDAIRKVVSLFELRLKEQRIDVRLSLDPGLRAARIDAQLFQEVVMNLVLNSADAIAGDGIITVSTRNDDDGIVAMEIRDNGTGIAPDDLKRIFDPFFTTKDVGTGTGLGLSVCMGIIESHGGRITVTSDPHTDTVFRITLPADERETAHH